jgi:hypothetical protein
MRMMGGVPDEYLRKYARWIREVPTAQQASSVGIPEAGSEDAPFCPIPACHIDGLSQYGDSDSP